MSTSTRPRPAVARDHCLAPGRTVGAPVYGGRYTRLFEGLPSLSGDERLLHAADRYGIADLIRAPALASF